MYRLVSNPGTAKIFVIVSNPGTGQALLLVSNPSRHWAYICTIVSNPGTGQILVLVSNPWTGPFSQLSVGSPLVVWSVSIMNYNILGTRQYVN